MILALILTPAIVVTDMVTAPDGWCQKPKTMSHGRCVRRTYQDDSRDRAAFDKWEEQARQQWEDFVIEQAEPCRCASKRSR